MTIQVRLMAAQAHREYAKLRAQNEQLERSTRQATAGMSGAFHASSAGITKWGSQMQWAGRQLTYNFTMPLALAAGAATKFALDNERAMVRVEKVYGDAAHGAEELKDEVDALSGAFEALSNRFGVNQAEVLGVAGDWAAAGASGIALAKAVKLTMETMILGELEAADATKALIAIQAQYGIGVDELAKSIDTLNMVENETGVTMGGLIDSMQRSAGVARSAGIDVRHLAALTAALVPAAGTASQAGNGLKTMISRLLSPTKEAAEVMGLMGLNVESLGWQTLNGVQRLELMAKSFEDLDDAQKAAVSSSVASRWQINRFDVLMRDIINTNGYYQRALNSTGEATKNYEQRVYELNRVLDSNPAKLKQMWTIIQNAMARVIQPAIPWIVYLAQTIANLGNQFAALDPSIQKMILIGGALLAVIGLLGRYLGATAVLFGMVAKAAAFAAAGFTAAFGAVGRLAAAPFRVIAAGFMAVNGAMLAAYSAITGAIVAVMAAAGGKLMAGFALIRTALVRFWTGPMLISTIMAFRLFAAQMYLAARSALITPIISTLTVGGMTGIIGALQRFMLALHGMVWAGMWMVQGAVVRAWAAVRAAYVAGALAMGTSNVLVAVLAGASQMFLAWYMSLGMLIAAGWARVRGIYSAGILALGAAGGISSMIATAMSSVNAAFLAGMARIQATVALGWARVTAFFTAGSAAFAASGGIIGALQRFMLAFHAMFFQMFWAIQGTVVRGWVAVQAAWAAGSINLAAVARRGMALLIGAMTGPIGWAITAVVLGFTVFRDEVAAIWNSIGDAFSKNSDNIGRAFKPVVDFFHAAVRSIGDAFNALPKAIYDPIMAVVNFVRTAAMKVYEWFGYMNPFVRHSPSLVESVTNGMAVIRKQYASVGNVGQVFAKAANDLKAYKTLAASLEFDEFSAQRADAANVMPQGLGLFNELVNSHKTLNALLREQDDLVNTQAAVVDRWKFAIQDANAALDIQENILKGMKTELDAIQATYDAHAAALQNYANSGIQGQRAMSDAMFENEMAQKRLRLEILKLEQAGGSVDDLKGKMASLQGEIEKLRGASNDLRAGGAGSDILGPLDAQITAMEEAYRKMGQGGGASPINDLQKQLDELEKKGQLLDLENAIQFDPLTRQIEQLSNGMKEMPFDQILAGINSERAAMQALEPAIAAATAAHDAQQATVDRMKVARDALQASYDLENQALQGLQDEYGRTRDAIGEIEDALNLVTGAARAARTAMEGGGGAGGAGGDLRRSPAADAFLAGEGANFPDVGGFEQIGREGGWESQAAEIEQFTADLAAETAGTLGAYDMWAPVKEKWNAFKGWWGTNVTPVWNALTDGIGQTFGTIGEGIDNSGVGDKFGKMWEGVNDFWNRIQPFIKSLGELFGPQLKEIWDGIVRAVAPAVQKVKDELDKWGPTFDKVAEAAVWLWNNVLKPLGAFLGGAFIATLSVVFSTLGNIIGPLFTWIGDVISTVMQFIRGAIQLVASLITGDFAGAMDGVATMIGAVWSLIVSTFQGAWDILYGLVKGIVEGIVDFFEWLYDVLVGHSIIPDLVNAVIKWFLSMKDKAIEFVKGLVDSAIQWFTDMGIKILTKVVELHLKVLAKWEDIKNGIIEKATLLRDAVVLGFDIMRDRLLGAWEYVKERIGGIMTSITDFIKVGINGGITAVNKLITGLNKVADILPGLDWNISAIPLLAKGGQIPGRRVGGGFETSGARAIVGEGNPLHPEFVIPTDPAYRKRASELYAKLGAQLGVHTDSPGWGIGGISEIVKGVIGNGASLVGKGMDWVSSAAQGAVSTIFGPVREQAQNMIDKMTWDYGKRMASAGLDRVWSWVTGADESYRKAAGEMGGNGPWRKPLSSYHKSSGYGMRVNPVTGQNRLHAGVDLAAPMGQAIYAAAQGFAQRFGGSTGLGNHVKIDHGGGLSTVYGHMSAFAGKMGSVSPGDLIGLIGSTGNSTGPHLHFEVRRGGAAINPEPWMMEKGVALARGGIVRASAGGTLATIGEGGRDEAVIPLPNGWREALNTVRRTEMPSRLATVTVQRLIVTGSVQSETLQPATHNEYKTINFYGDLSFPNVKDKDDAEGFIRNLDDLAGGR